MSKNVYFVCPKCHGVTLKFQGSISYDHNFLIDQLMDRAEGWKGWIVPSVPKITAREITSADDCCCYCDDCWERILTMEEDESYFDFSERLQKWLLEHGMYDSEEEECSDSICG